MPLTSKGKKIKYAMQKKYGKEHGERVFWASKNAGKIRGVDKGFCGHMDPGSLVNHGVINTSVEFD